MPARRLFGGLILLSRHAFGREQLVPKGSLREAPGEVAIVSSQ